MIYNIIVSGKIVVNMEKSIWVLLISLVLYKTRKLPLFLKMLVVIPNIKIYRTSQSCHIPVPDLRVKWTASLHTQDP